MDRYKSNLAQLLVEAQVQPDPSKHVPTAHPLTTVQCVCSLCGGKTYSRWSASTSFAAAAGSSTAQYLSKTAWDCPLRTPEDSVLPLLLNEELRDKYRCYLFRDYMDSHCQLQLCPGADCPRLIQVPEPRARQVQCDRRNEVFSFKCRPKYHTPTDCATIWKWLLKCADDSETANYICAHTKDGPKCNVCIEKNRGCNHMQCSKCPYSFCWVCLGQWSANCGSRATCGSLAPGAWLFHKIPQPGEALKKYLFYFERWETHTKSLQLEAQTYQRIHEKIQERVMHDLGMWIDGQYLQNPAKLLAKCRYTLQYTYPCAYYMESGPREKLFEYQQAQLEAEIENLSWKMECADSDDRGDLGNQTTQTEQRRRATTPRLDRDMLEQAFVALLLLQTATREHPPTPPPADSH
ncbi:hypothetical protein QTO34_019949 [Cnephaeus nilssonii]|uniref:RBR-type E3 ubiquitin transferase n=1 Tax=Cnephaeus nilssonii TaxID=3371016 RepID=A0AA40LPS5_CNENI|nr:hypothetical protein QTO34_019949 [Eptesicus nilssonii]